METRSLYNPETAPELEIGKIQMWIDLFPLNDNIHLNLPKPVDVSLRKPKKFQLRVIIHKTKNVILYDQNLITGDKSSDIYIRGYLCDQVNEYCRTDVHYRSSDGNGYFNWRFMFNFDYLPVEERIVYKTKNFFRFTNDEQKSKPILTLECFDFGSLSDHLLGKIELDLSKLKKGTSNYHSCSLKMFNDLNWSTINLFKNRVHRGWWPFYSPKNNQELTVR